MANRVKQFRYYNEPAVSGGTRNQPSDATETSFVSGTVFDMYYPILQLGIQALPGTRFYLNNAVDPVIIGSTGIYELDLIGKTEISNIKFDFNSMELIKDNANAFLIVDIIYDDGEEQ